MGDLWASSAKGTKVRMFLELTETLNKACFMTLVRPKGPTKVLRGVSQKESGRRSIKSRPDVTVPSSGHEIGKGPFLSDIMEDNSNLIREYTKGVKARTKSKA